MKPEKGETRVHSKDSRSKSKDNKKRGESKSKDNGKNKRDNKFQRKKGAPKWKNIEAEVE